MRYVCHFQQKLLVNGHTRTHELMLRTTGGCFTHAFYKHPTRISARTSSYCYVLLETRVSAPTALPLIVWIYLLSYFRGGLCIVSALLECGTAVQGHLRSLILPPIESVCMISHWWSIATTPISQQTAECDRQRDRQTEDRTVANAELCITSSADVLWKSNTFSSVYVQLRPRVQSRILQSGTIMLQCICDINPSSD